MTPPTAHELILQAARTLPQPFARGDLVVAAWRLAPERFGLLGHEQAHPDSNKVLSSVFGVDRGMVSRGMLRPVGKLFCVVDSTTDSKEPKLPAVLERASKSAAFASYNTGGKESITFPEALAFWGLHGNAERDSVEPSIAKVSDCLLDRDTPELRVFGACHDFLLDRFDRHLKLAKGKPADRTSKPHKRGKMMLAP